MTFPVPPQYRPLIFQDLVITENKERLWGYVDRDGDGTFAAPKHIHIFDYKLSQDELDEHNYEPVPEQSDSGFELYALYTPTSEGQQYYGWGLSSQFAVAHTLYQAIRTDHWSSGLGFIPEITFQEALIFSNTQCIPTEIMRFENKEEMNEYIDGATDKPIAPLVDDVWVCEYAPNEFVWSDQFEKVVELLLPHLPESHEVH